MGRNSVQSQFLRESLIRLRNRDSLASVLRTTYTAYLSCRTEPPKMPRLEYPQSGDTLTMAIQTEYRQFGFSLCAPRNSTVQLSTPYTNPERYNKLTLS